jgi:hypothetical protein
MIKPHRRGAPPRTEVGLMLYTFVLSEWLQSNWVRYCHLARMRRRTSVVLLELPAEESRADTRSVSYAAAEECRVRLVL